MEEKFDYKQEAKEVVGDIIRGGIIFATLIGISFYLGGIGNIIGIILLVMLFIRTWFLLSITDLFISSALEEKGITNFQLLTTSAYRSIRSYFVSLFK